MTLDIQKITELRKEYIEAVKVEEYATAQLSDMRLDVRIAQRDGEEERADDLAKVADEYCTKQWYPAYRATKDAAEELCEALGLSAEEFGGKLR